MVLAVYYSKIGSNAVRKSSSILCQILKRKEAKRHTLGRNILVLQYVPGSSSLRNFYYCASSLMTLNRFEVEWGRG
jgi:hypothetical protein